MTDNNPSVSVILPARDAAETLTAALDSIAGQTYRRIIEVIVAAADEESQEIASAHGATVVQNPGGRTPSGLNRAISASHGEVIVRCDAHSMLPAEYVERAVRTLLETGASNVGGMQIPTGVTFWERAIAAAMKSPIGAGDARYRIGGVEGPVETVYLGVFRREALDRVGGFDEQFTRTQDYELNHRIIESGGTVWFDPNLKVTYRPRGSLSSLAQQYFEYGKAKRLFRRRHPGALKWRQLAAPALVVGLGTAVVISIVWPLALWVPAGYSVVLAGTGLIKVPSEGTAAFGIPPALATMHLAWGTGFLIG